MRSKSLEYSTYKNVAHINLCGAENKKRSFKDPSRRNDTNNRNQNSLSLLCPLSACVFFQLHFHILNICLFPTLFLGATLYISGTCNIIYNLISNHIHYANVLAPSAVTSQNPDSNHEIERQFCVPNLIYLHNYLKNEYL